MKSLVEDLRVCLRTRAPHIAAATIAAVVLGACTTAGTREAPIVDKSRGSGRPDPARAASPVAPVQPAPALTREARDGSYVVQRGDTLYSIALAFGQDFRDLARWNGIDDPAKISVGQALRVVAPDGDNAAAASGVASTVPIQPIGSIESRPLANAPAPMPLPPVGGSASASPGAPAAPAGASAPSAPVVSASGAVVGSGAPAAASSSAPQPVAPGWAGGARPAASGTATAPSPVAPVAPVAPVGTAPVPTAPVISGGAAAATKPTDPATEIAKVAPRPGATPESSIGWAWPATGKVIEEFHETRNKGIDIGGKEGDAVLAAGDGQIVYSGSGLRGYGNLVIIKHTDDYISAYAHNRQILVKQGQAVKRGQRIAELGKSDADTPKLHFEIRRQGKPVDPLKYLPSR